MLALLEKSQRSYGVPLRRTFVQQRVGSTFEPGPLAKLVRSHDERALDLYLMMRALATREPFRAELDAAVWARALGVEGSTASAQVSRIWRRLEDLGLIGRARAGRTASITPLCEDGSGAAYSRPNGASGDPYFQVPLEYWKDEWDRRLPLVGKAALLIALSLPAWFRLPAEKSKDWYGISADTWERGLGVLRDHELIKRRSKWKKAPLTPDGHVRVYEHHLEAPFAHRKSAGEVRLRAVS